MGIAYLDANKMGFDIVDPSSGNIRIASLKRNFVLDVVDNWEVVVYRPDVAQEILRIFSAFVVDRQNSWKKDK